MREWSNQLEKYVRSLYIPKFRKNYGKFIAEGNKICSEILKSSEFEIEYILARTAWIQRNEYLMGDNIDKLVVIEGKDLIKLAQQKSGIQVLIVANKKEENINVSLIKSGYSIFLDDVQDPGNLGSILRIADWFNWKTIIRSPGSADFYNPKVVQASMGSFLRVGMATSDFDSIYKTLPDHSYYGTSMQGENLFEKNKTYPIGMLVIGNEGKGISTAIKDKMTKVISIPKLGAAESLNAAVACGIIVSQLSQR